MARVRLRAAMEDSSGLLLLRNLTRRQQVCRPKIVRRRSLAGRARAHRAPPARVRSADEDSVERWEAVEAHGGVARRVGPGAEDSHLVPGGELERQLHGPPFV